MKLIDVTLRESVYYGKGLTNEEGLRYLSVLKESIPAEKLEWVEIGYINNDTEGALNYNEEYITRAAEICEDTFKMSAMMHPGKADISRWNPAVISKFDLVRMVVGQKINPEVKTYVDYFHQLGVKVSVNVTYVTRIDIKNVIEQMNIAKDMGMDYFYCADSSGSLTPSGAVLLAKTMLANAGEMKVGLHLHDHMHMALANALVARDVGLEMTDASVTGAGKGGGNLKLEEAIPVLNGTQDLTGSNLIAAKRLIAYFSELIAFPVEQNVQVYVDFLTGVYRLNLKEQDQLEKMAEGNVDTYLLGLAQAYVPAEF